MTTELAPRRITASRPDHSKPRTTPVIAFLGTGRMGGPMAANLARAGFEVRAWDRTASHAAALAGDGATAAASPAEAVRGAGILITMLADGPATEQVWNGPDGLSAAGPGLIWVQMATVGLEWTQRFANTAARYGVHFFDAPVSGSQGPAQAGELTILASGPHWMAEAVAPVFEVLGRATTWLGPAGNGTRAKLVLNNWLADITETTAETLSFARQLGLDPAAIVDLLESTPLGSPYAMQKARTMLAGDFTPAFALKHALKDADLAAQAAQESGAELTLTSALLPRWRRAVASGHADDDLAAIYTTP
ncbi:MAG TPA: NAD(P)-dependent oxidoreductase [Streptosporangiaceae bacterium]|jgi:3-hydroxyisobutyrate dehydrogenase|nr:NAD(P)-dependent oxidoreductase [Streptosporangiaceae bacterium]